MYQVIYRQSSVVTRAQCCDAAPEEYSLGFLGCEVSNISLLYSRKATRS